MPSTVFRLTPQQEKQKRDVNKLISSLPANQQKSIKALGLHMSERLLLKPIPEADVRKIFADNIEKVAAITRPNTVEMLLNHTELSLFYGMLAQIEQMAAKAISKIREIKAALREEISMLRDIVASWPEQDSEQEITYRLAVRQSDGSWKLIEKTQLMNKNEVQNLISKLEQQINEMSEILETGMPEIQHIVDQQNQNYQAVSSFLKEMHELAMAAIRNMR